FDFVITVCDNAKERCPFCPTKAEKVHHNFSAPAQAKGTDEEINEQLRQVRQQIKEYCERCVAENLTGDQKGQHLTTVAVAQPLFFKNKLQKVIGLNLLLLLGYFNYSIRQKEALLKTRKSVLLELAPVDPRSIMQGDYMELR